MVQTKSDPPPVALSLAATGTHRLHPPRIFNVLDARNTPSDHLHRHRIEAVVVARLPLPINPGSSDLLNFAPFLPGDGFQWMTVPETRTGLHFNERDDLATACDEIDLLAAHPEVTVENRPSCALEEAGSELLTTVTQ